MTAPSNDAGGNGALIAAIEEYLANMSAADFRALVYRVRPPDETLPLSTDPAVRIRGIADSIAAKQRHRPQVDHNGHSIES